MSPRRRLLLAALVVALALGGLVGLNATRGRTPAVASAAPVPQDRPGPVLLVPGYGGGQGSLRALASRLRSAGRDARVLPGVGDNKGDLGEQAEALHEAVSAALDAGAPSVDLVGFSAGGVVVRLWAAEHDGRGRARRIVTLGAPHHGTEVASTALALLPSSCPEACRQLAGESDLLGGLNRGDETPDGPRWVSVWTTGDRTVTPPQTARLDGAVNVELQQVCADARVEHGELPRDALSVGVVLRALGPGLDAPPPPSQCRPLRALGAG